MRYFYGKGVLTPHAKNFWTAAMSAAAVLLLLQAVLPSGNAGAVEFDQQAAGQIQGAIYNDLNGNGSKDIGEPYLENWSVYLLTHNSPFTVAGTSPTDSNGLFLFQGLPLGTYYVCQDLQAGWAQTELGPTAIGVGSSLTVGTVLADTDEIHDFIDEFCYQVILTSEEQLDEGSVFGNILVGQQENGPSATKPEPDDNTTAGDGQAEGEVLAASAGQVLAATGQSTHWTMLLGVLLLTASLVSATVTPRRK